MDAGQDLAPLVVDLLTEDRQQYLVVQAAEAVGDVPFDEPGSPGPGMVHLPQCGVAAPAGTEPMRAVGERRLVKMPQVKRRITSPTSLSDQVGSPNGRVFPFFFGIWTRRTGRKR